MALSNIFREPRREITESAVGTVLAGGLIYADYAFGYWLSNYAGCYSSNDGICRHEIPWGLGMLIGLFCMIVLGLFIFLTHEIGDAICNALQRQGIHLRPRNRPR